MKAEEFYGHIPEMLTGDLPENERGAMEQALAERKEFRQAKFVAEVMREAFIEFPDDQLLEHPSAQYLLRYSEERERVPEHVRESIELHLATCGVCQEVIERLEQSGFGESRTTVSSGPEKTARNRVLLWLLHPALAASYLVAFIGLAGWTLVQQQSLAPAQYQAVTPAPQLVFADPLYRSDTGESEPLPIEAGAMSRGRLHLLVQTEMPELATTGSTMRLVIADESGRSRSTIDVAPESINRFGTLSVVIDATSYQTGEIYRLQLMVESRAVFERRIVLE